MMMLRPREVSYYFPLQDAVAKKAVEKLATEVDEDGVVSNLNTLISQWILECKNKEVTEFCEELKDCLVGNKCD